MNSQACWFRVKHVDFISPKIRSHWRAVKDEQHTRFTFSFGSWPHSAYHGSIVGVYGDNELHTVTPKKVLISKEWC